jgi:dihydroorotate dehydrogenase
MAAGGHVPSFTPAPVSAPPRSSRPLIVVAVVLGLAVILAGTYALGRFTAPTGRAAVSTPTITASAPANTTATATKTGTPSRVGFTLTGSTLSGPGFTAKMPSGWTLAADNGVVDNDGSIENGSNNSLTYFASDPTSATTRCHNAFESYRTKLGGAVVDLPGVQWANDTAVVKELETKYSTGQAIGLNIYCVDRPGNTSAAILSIADPNHQETNKAAAEVLLASWAWT